jgi:ribosomal peptide maturation radical SAM protein 1
MPWQELSRPSLSIGVLRGVCADNGLPAPLTYHGGLRFAEFLLDRSDGALTPYEYTAVAESGFMHVLGDWVFAGALNGTRFGYEEMRRYAARKELHFRTVMVMRELADEFVDLVADELIAEDPELVGFTTTFMQNVPSLAVARRLKERRPEIKVLFGGGNCDGPMGVALHREFGFVDLVLRGEADETFPLLLQSYGTETTVPGLCWRDGNGEQRVNPPPRLVPPAKLTRPDFDDWFEAFRSSPIGRYIEPELAVESARGCWWGEHHHCTFCGLNGSAMAFRAKPPESFVAELDHLVRRHQVLDVTVVDNILEPTYLRTALPEVAERGWDLRLHYEVKANLSTAQVGTLAAAGVYSVQPGIESLVDDVLDRMNKGVRAVHNVRTMRDCESVGLTVSWNWLYGFPGEQHKDYAAVLAELSRLVHLQPPDGVARIGMNRFSPHFEDPSLGFPERSPAEPYHYVYDLTSEQLDDLVYLFDTPPQGLSDEQAEPLRAAVDTWLRAYPESSLRRLDVDDVVVLRDRRVGWPHADYVLEEDRERHAWGLLEQGGTAAGMLRKLDDADLAWDPDALSRWLAELHDRGMVFTAKDRWVALATTAVHTDAAVPQARLAVRQGTPVRLAPAYQATPSGTS